MTFGVMVPFSLVYLNYESG